MVVALGPGAVEMIWAALGMKHREGGTVVWGCWMREVWASQGLLDVGHHGARWCGVAWAVREALAVCQRGQVLEGWAGARACRHHGHVMGWAGGVAADQAGIRISHGHDGSQSGLAVKGLRVHGQPGGPQGIILIAGLCLYYRHWEGENKGKKDVKKKKNVQGNPRGMMSAQE